MLVSIRQWVKRYRKLLILYVVFALILAGMIAAKKNYFVDEIYSYGLANHVAEDGRTIWMTPKLAPYTYSSGGEPFYDYVTVKKGQQFRFANVWRNQSNDVHPPFYYAILHLVCSFFPERFSKWLAGAVNIFFALLTLGGVRALSKELGCDESDRNVITLLFVFSAGIMGAVAYLRMYVMFMCEVTWLTWMILRWRGRENKYFYILVTSLSIVGALTQYYFLIYLFFISVMYGISLLVGKSYMAALKYCGAMVCAGCLSCLIFPAMIRHIFGGSGRGGEAFAHLGEGMDRFFLFLQEILKNINRVWFGETLIIVAVTAILYVYLKYCMRAGADAIRVQDFWKWMIPGGAVVGYLILLAKIATSVSNRFYVPVYAVTVVVVVAGVKTIADRICHGYPQITGFLLLLWVAVMLTSGWTHGAGANLYRESGSLLEAMENYGHIDALYVWPGGPDAMYNFLDIAKLRSVTFFEGDVSELEHMEDLKSQPEYILYVMEEEESNGQEILEEIRKYCPQITQSEIIGRYGEANIYHICGN